MVMHPTQEPLASSSLLDVVRQTAVDTLQDPRVSTLLLEGTEEVSRSHLVRLAACQYNVSPGAYCERMRLPNTWGGGPEIAALSHALDRVIVVYEIDERVRGSRTTPRQSAGHHLFWTRLSDRFALGPSTPTAVSPVLKVVACFGFPRNTAQGPLHILFANAASCSAVGGPGSAQRADHFLPLFPCLVSE